MKIMVCSDLAPPYTGGGESYMTSLSHSLVRLGHEVYWFTSRLPGTKDYEYLEGIHVCRVPIFLSTFYKFPGRQSFPLTGLLPAIRLAMRMNVLQFNTFVAGTFGWLVAKASRKPCLLYCHEMFGDLWRRIGQNSIEKHLYPKVEKFIATSPYDYFACPSEYSKKTLIQAGAASRNISVIPHGVDFSLFNPEARGDALRKSLGLEGFRLLGFTGRLAVKRTGQSKNLVALIEAVKYVVNELPDAKLVLGGFGFEDISPIIRRLGVEEHVVCAGARSFIDVPSFISMCDVVVCPALADGFCFLLAEASACGKPVVATREGAHPERVVDGVTGVLTDGSSEGLAEGVVKVLSDQDFSEKLGRNGAEYARDQYSWERSAKRHLEIYEEIIKKYAS